MTKALVGIVERYDESIVYFENCLKIYFPEIDLSYVKQNVSNLKRNKITQNKLLSIHLELGAELTKKLYQENYCDLAVYDLGVGLLNKKYFENRKH